MSELKTEELTEILKQTTDIDVFLDDNELLPNVSLAEYINELVEEKKTKIADVARRAHMSSSYLYKLGEGKRKSPTRNKALQICFGLGLDIDEISGRRCALFKNCTRQHYYVLSGKKTQHFKV